MLSTSRGALLALFLAPLALRPQMIGVGPLLPEIQHDLGISHAVAGLLITIPLFCLGAFAPLALMLLRRVRARDLIGLSLGAIAVFGVGRVLSLDPVWVVALTLPVGAAMGVAGAALPVLVKESFADRPAFATGVYATGLNVGVTLAAALAVPAAALAGWRGALALFSLGALALLAAWLVLAPRGPRGDSAPAVRHGRHTRGPVFLLVGAFALHSLIFHSLVAWLPDLYVERGWTEESAAALLTVLNVVTIPVTLLIPWFVDRVGSRRFYLVTSAALLLAAELGFVLAPAAAWLWAVTVGVAIGVMLPVQLTLPLDVEDDPERVAVLAASMLGAGYILSSVGPSGLGLLRDVSGSFAASLWLLVVAGAALLAVSALLSAARLARPLVPER